MNDADDYQSAARKKDARRAEFLEAATDVFFRSGFVGASVNEVIAKVGGSKRTIYSYFGNKEQLFATIAEEISTRAMAPLAEGSFRQGDVSSTLYEVGSRYISVVMSPEALLAGIPAQRQEDKRINDRNATFVEPGVRRLAQPVRAPRSRVELRQIRYVIAAAEYGSFRKAASALRVHESSISRQIKSLEDEIGAALFTRDHRGVCLTQAGNRFLTRARRAMGQIVKATNEVGSFGRGERGSVRIGIFTSLAGGFLANLVRAFIARHPDTSPILSEGSALEHIVEVRKLHLDVAFVTGRPEIPDCDCTHLWDERIFLALPKHDPLVAFTEIGWDQLRGRNFIVSETDPGPEIHDYLIKNLATLGDRPRVERHQVSRDNLMHLVAMDQGLTLTSEASTMVQFPTVSYRPIADEILPFSAVWSPQNDNPALRRFLSMARVMSKARARMNQPLGPGMQ